MGGLRSVGNAGDVIVHKGNVDRYNQYSCLVLSGMYRHQRVLSSAQCGTYLYLRSTVRH